jgi:hypothetical protein
MNLTNKSDHKTRQHIGQAKGIGHIWRYISVAAIVVGLYAMWPSGVDLRYSVNMEVDVDGVPHVGTSVVEATIGHGFDTPYSYSVQAEAIAIDLGESGYLFVVMRGRDGSYGAEGLADPEEAFNLMNPLISDARH